MNYVDNIGLRGLSNNSYLKFLKFACAVESVSANMESCKLFKEQTNNAWAKVGSTTAGHPKGATAEILSKIWSIYHVMAARTLKVTTQLNRIGENSDLAQDLGTNDQMLQYRRIKSHFFTKSTNCCRSNYK